MECTGVGRVISESTSVLGASGVICLTGVGYGGAITQVPAANVASSAMLKNSVMFGSVNANKRHWQKAAEALERAGRNWLSGLLTRFEKPERLGKAFERNPEEIKTIIQFKG
jgi:threonine dehydrogenase-like Zn-dependent dehydrogenase